MRYIVAGALAGASAGLLMARRREQERSLRRQTAAALEGITTDLNRLADSLRRLEHVTVGEPQ